MPNARVVNIFYRKLEPEVERLLTRVDHMSDDERITALKIHGFIVVWSDEVAEGMVRLGARAAIATPSDKGAHWSEIRAIGKGGHAYYVLEEDRAFFSTLLDAMRGLDFTGGERKKAIDALVQLCLKRGFSNEHMLALETVARLGGADAVKAFLESDGGA